MDRHLVESKYAEQFQEIKRLPFNYDEQAYVQSPEKIGWNVDTYESVVAREPLGPPVPDGAFFKIQHAIADYDFADPGLIQVAFDKSSPLLGRNILMLAKFPPFTFTFGVRVTEVMDDVDVATGDHARDQSIWGFCYRTLEGHFEVGQICFSVIKYHRSGEIAVRIHAHSKPSRISNPFYRLGFKLFGRSLQRRFAKDAIANLGALA